MLRGDFLLAYCDKKVYNVTCYHNHAKGSFSMKRFLSGLIVIMILACLGACGKASPATPATTGPSTTVATDPVHCHSYRDADCTTPKTCMDCGYTRGDALGHDYTEGVCSRCGMIDATYLPLTSTQWTAVSENENSSQLELITLVFTDDSCSISGVTYFRLSDVPMDQWDDAMRNEENWYDYGGEIYYRKQKTAAQTLYYLEDGNVITCDLYGPDAVLSTLILERTAGNMLSVTYFEGSFHVQFLTVGDVFSGIVSANA